MKLTAESTDVIVEVNGLACRIWEATTDSGAHCHLFVHRLAISEDIDAAPFDLELISREPRRELDPVLTKLDDLRTIAAPSPGDFSMCIECGGFARFGHDLHLVETTPEEIDAAGVSAELAKMRRALDQLKDRERREAEPAMGWVLAKEGPRGAIVTATVTDPTTRLDFVGLALFDSSAAAEVVSGTMATPAMPLHVTVAMALDLATTHGGCHGVILHEDSGRTLVIGHRKIVEEVFPHEPIVGGSQA